MVKMLKHAALAFLLVVFAFSCQSPKQEMISEIEQMENNLFGDEGKLNPEQVENLISAYEQYAVDFPDDSLAPVYLFKAGDIAMNTGRSNKAITFYSRIIEEYPGYPKVPEALFLQAYVYENNLGRLDKARSLYEEFLHLYPDNEFADDAKVSLKYLGKTPEELIEIFQKEQEVKE